MLFSDKIIFHLLCRQINQTRLSISSCVTEYRYEFCTNIQIHMLYPLNTAFWLDDFWEWVKKNFYPKVWWLKLYYSINISQLLPFIDMSWSEISYQCNLEINHDNFKISKVPFLLDNKGHDTGSLAGDL